MKATKKVWILSFRVSGNDGVSLEDVRWGTIFRRQGYKVVYVAGELDRNGLVIPDLHFNSPDVYDLHNKVVYGKNSFKQVQKDIYGIAGKIEGQLRDALNGKPPDLLVVSNVFSLPMHFPLSIALARIIEEHKIPTIARHHDFWWERKRFLRSTMFPFFKKWFPPNIPFIKHTVINSIAQNQLLKRYGIKSEIISDTFDFNLKLNNGLDSYSKNFRTDFGIKKNDRIFLQATRIVPRKRIELSIKLIDQLNDHKNVLVIAGHAGDEGVEYFNQLKELASKTKAKILFIGEYVNSRRKITRDGRRIYTLWDAFRNSDIVTYPTELEGFGNQFIEAVYFKKPVVLSPYLVFKKDIKPLGFGYIDIFDKKIKEKLENSQKLAGMVEINFKLGKKNYSYEATWEKIKELI
jgi:glycosyltransferase involved in cell wall biosynthesis